MTHEVFISYAKPDQKLADVLCDALESQRIRCWIAPRDVIPGQGYGAQILEAIEASKLLVLVFSGNSNTSQHVTREIERAVNKAVTILTFRIEDVAPTAELEYFISATHWLDAIEPPMKRHIEHLVEAVRRNLGTPVLDTSPGASHDGVKPRSKDDAEARHQADAAQLQVEREEASRNHDHAAPHRARAGASERSESDQSLRKPSRRWLYAGGITAMIVAAAVMLNLYDAPPSPPSASGNDARKALDAQRDIEEKARSEAAAAKSQADAEIVKLRTEANVALARAEAELAKLRAEAAHANQVAVPAPGTSASPPTPEATSQAGIAAAKARSDAALAKKRAEANLAAAKAKAMAARPDAAANAARTMQVVPPASKTPASAPEPATGAPAPAATASSQTSVATAAPAAVATARPPAAVSRPDDAWIAERFCAGFTSVPAIKDQLDVVFKDGEFIVATGRRGDLGYVSMRGKRNPDGKLKLSGYQLEMSERSGRTAPMLEEQFAVVEGQLEGDRYPLKGRMAGRACTVTLSRR